MARFLVLYSFVLELRQLIGFVGTLLEAEIMPFANVIAHRSLVIFVNALSLLCLLYLVFESVQISGSVEIGALLPAIAPTAGILAFVTPQSFRQWLVTALVINALSLIVWSLAIVLAARVQSQSVPPLSQMAVLVVDWAAPLMTIVACVLRLPSSVPQKTHTQSEHQ